MSENWLQVEVSSTNQQFASRGRDLDGKEGDLSQLQPDGAQLIASRSDVLRACVSTSAGIALAGACIRQVCPSPSLLRFWGFLCSISQLDYATLSLMLYPSQHGEEWFLDCSMFKYLWCYCQLWYCTHGASPLGPQETCRFQRKCMWSLISCYLCCAVKASHWAAVTGGWDFPDCTVLMPCMQTNNSWEFNPLTLPQTHVILSNEKVIGFCHGICSFYFVYCWSQVPCSIWKLILDVSIPIGSCHSDYLL